MRAGRRHVAMHRRYGHPTSFQGALTPRNFPRPVGHFCESAALEQMRIGPRRAGIAITPRWERRHGPSSEMHSTDGMALRPLLDRTHHLFPVGAARRHGGKSGVVGEFGLPRHLRKGPRNYVAWMGRNQDIAVPGTNRAIGRARRLARKLGLLQLVDQQVQHAIHQGDGRCAGQRPVRPRCTSAVWIASSTKYSHPARPATKMAPDAGLSLSPA